MSKPKKPKTTDKGSRADYGEAWQHFTNAARAAGRGAGKDATDAYEWAKPRVKAAAESAAQATKKQIKEWYNNLSADDRWNKWRQHGVLPISVSAKRKAAQIHGINAVDEAEILYELECKAIGKPFIKIEFDNDNDTDVRQKIENLLSENTTAATMTVKTDKVDYIQPFIHRRAIPDSPNKTRLTPTQKKRMLNVRIPISVEAQERQGQATDELIALLKKHLPLDWVNARNYIAFLETMKKTTLRENDKYQRRYNKASAEVQQRIDRMAHRNEEFGRQNATLEYYDEVSVFLADTLKELLAPEYATQIVDGYLIVVDNPLNLQPLHDAEISGRKKVLAKGWFNGMSSDDVRSLLEAHDFTYVSTKGSHVKYTKNNCHVVFPENKKVINTDTLSSIKKQFDTALQNED